MPHFDRANHHVADKQIRRDEQQRHRQSQDQNRFTGKGIADGKGRRNKGRIWEDE